MSVVSVQSPNSSTRTYTNSDGTTFTQTGGTLAWRNNNPGNLIYGAFAQANGAIGQDPNGFAIFPDAQTGQAALQSLITNTYGSSTINNMLNAYAPPSENDTTTYQNFINNNVGVSGNTLINQLTPTQLQSLIKGIETFEGTSPGTTSGTPDTSGSITANGQQLNFSSGISPVVTIDSNGNLSVDLGAAPGSGLSQNVTLTSTGQLIQEGGNNVGATPAGGTVNSSADGMSYMYSPGTGITVLSNINANGSTGLQVQDTNAGGFTIGDSNDPSTGLYIPSSLTLNGSVWQPTSQSLAAFLTGTTANLDNNQAAATQTAVQNQNYGDSLLIS